jgi:hypothetical protein
VKDIHELDCDDVIWGEHKRNISTYDHNYTNEQVLPCLTQARHSNWWFLNAIEHNYSQNEDDVNVTEGTDTRLKMSVSDKPSQVKPSPLALPLSEHNYNKPANTSKINKCPNCWKIYKYAVVLQKHIGHCHRRGRVTCRTCGRVCDNHRELYNHKMKEHRKYKRDQLQKPPWTNDTGAPWGELEEQDKEGFKRTYTLHQSIILAPNQVSDIVSIYNMPCQNDVNSNMIIDFVSKIYDESQRTFKISFSAGLILRHIITGEYRYWKPYRNQEFFTDPFVISSRSDIIDLKEMLETFDLYGYTLKQRPDTKFKCVLITNIQMFVFETAYTLGNESLNLPGYLTMNKYIICLDKMISGKHKKPYKDFLCAFRCLAYHKDPLLYKISRHSFEVLTLKLFKEWSLFMDRNHHQNITAHDFKGIFTNELSVFEDCFSISIDVFEKLDKDTVIPIYRTKNKYIHKMTLNVHKNHLSYVTDFRHYAKKFKCVLCHKLFTSVYSITKHTETCLKGTKIKFRGGVFHRNNDVWDELELFGVCIEAEQKKYNHFIVFDYECMLETSSKHFGSMTQADPIHKPISVSTCGNCCDKHRQPVCIVEEDFDVLINKWLLQIEEISKHIREQTNKKWGNILNSLNDLKKKLDPDIPKKGEVISDATESSDCEEVSIEMTQALQKENVYQQFLKKLNEDKWSVEYNQWSSDSSEEDDATVDPVDYTIINDTDLENIDDDTRNKMFKRVIRLCNKMDEYINQVPIIGYYSSKYDILVIRSQLIQQLGLHLPKIKKKQHLGQYVIKRGESYPCIATPKYKFLDITEYIGGHVSYAQFLRSMKVTTGRKLFFPFEAIREFSDLNNSLPHMNSHLWYSSVKQKSLLDDGVDSIETDYKLIKKIWDDYGMRTLRDLLVVYNNSDCGPFITAVESFQNIFQARGISVFKSGVISAPGLSRKLLYATAEEQNIPITLFDEKNADLYYSFKKQCYGGASIIFSRYHKVGQTYIRGNPEHVCQSILGIDGVALYLYCISSQMPIGFCIRRRANNDFKPEVSDRALSTVHWLTWLNEINKKHILHRYNTGGKERSLANFRLDGWDPIEKMGYEMYGCYIHGHKHANKRCFLSKNMDSDLAEERYKRTQAREIYLKQFCKVKTIWECSFYNLVRSNKELRLIIDKSRPMFYKQHKGRVTVDVILKAVRTNKIFGFIEVDLSVDEDELSARSGDRMTKYQYLMEMCPIFGTADITYDHAPKIMKDFMTANNISKTPRRQLIGTLSGKKMMIHTHLLKFYMEIGLTVTHVYQVVEYSGHRVF